MDRNRGRRNFIFFRNRAQSSNQDSINSANRPSQGNDEQGPSHAKPYNARHQHQFQRARNRNYSTNLRIRSIGLPMLQELLLKDDESLILEMSKINKELAAYLCTDSLSHIEIVLVIQIFRKVSYSSFLDIKRVVFQTCFSKTFVKLLKDFIVSLPSQGRLQKMGNAKFWNDPDDFCSNLLGIVFDILTDIPTFATSVFPPLIKALKVYMPSFELEHNIIVSDEIKTKIANLHVIMEKSVQANEASFQKLKPVDIDQTAEPPEDFRLIPLYPSSAEILGQKGFLRKNIIEGPFRDPEQYLDIQFRLLREDFIAPIRNAITAYRSDSYQVLENIRIYRRVWFLEHATINGTFCVRLKFDFRTNQKRANFENSKRFMFGALLCFTMDDFKTIFFGKVGNRDVEDLQKGELIVSFEQDVPLVFKRDHLMVECNVYFEPYYHVLSVLQTMPTIDFPMEKYIIRVDPSSEPPKYLTRALTDPLCTIEVEEETFNPLLPWPNETFYNFNTSQSVAFQAAVSQKFSIIQGPPGTGKTYLGLKVAQTLLENRHLWYHNTPMLIICFTNHALDQFLEGILEFTQNIVRVGGQSQNVNLNEYNLRNHHSFEPDSAVYRCKTYLKEILNDISSCVDLIAEIDNFHSILPLSFIKWIIPNCMGTWFCSVGNREFYDWLFMGNMIGDMFYSSLTEWNEEITRLNDKYNSIICNEIPTDQQLLDQKMEFEELEAARSQCAQVQASLEQARTAFRDPIPPPPERVDFRNPHKMFREDRWKLYCYWLSLLKNRKYAEINYCQKKFRQVYKLYEQSRNVEHTRIMKEVNVIGMTTTSAARLRHSLQALKCPVVIVEEAAEVLESHIVSSLTSHCQHLILIGDHQQLKPNTADYHLQKKFNFGVSLFERMVLNGIQCHTLNVQHRMRPEISALIAPTIYPDLQNHRSVNDRPEIRGIEKNLFFIDHQHREDSCEDSSKRNVHEATFLISLARHLVLNGYEPEQITILAAYLGQMYEMKRVREQHQEILGKVRIAVLDNYQGEESDIILLSLVRNNEDNKVGFLKIENRVCVALSRARNGLYIMGNMAQLCHESDLWCKIRTTLEKQGSLGTELQLRCQIHRNTVTNVSKSTDFLLISEGGCTQICGEDLMCGHKCKSLCHFRDIEHKIYKCQMTCYKNLCTKTDLHVCLKMCYQECGPCTYKEIEFLKCGYSASLECHLDPTTFNCPRTVKTNLPCGHKVNKPCYQNASFVRCPYPCEIMVEPCGHACRTTCHINNDPNHINYKCRKPCARCKKGCTSEIKHMCQKFCYEECDPCTEIVPKQRTICPHMFNVSCCSDVDELECKKPCKRLLECGHECTNTCGEPCSNGSCQKLVSKKIPLCGHPIQLFCSMKPVRDLCKLECPLMLPCGHPCTTKCNEPCTKECQVVVDAKVTSPCGHEITKAPCYLTHGTLTQDDPKLLLEHCREPCAETLKCGDSCTGSCGECLQGRIHKSCLEKCKAILICDHECKAPCRQACRPCTKKCFYKCVHSACGKKCADVCTACKEKCPRVCPHQKCTKFCGDICDVPPCKENCLKTLICGHPCIGFCGDVCPPKCLLCDKAEVLEIFFGTEEDVGARFVYLNDCKHILESTGLEQWLEQDDDKIGFKVCPRCKTSIKTTQRYSHLIKRAVKDVALVKIQLSGSPKENSDKKQELQEKFGHLLSVNTKLLYSQSFQTMAKRLLNPLTIERPVPNKIQLNDTNLKLQIIERMVTIFTEHNCNSSSLEISKLLTSIAQVIDLRYFITDQEIEDVTRELNRLTRMLEFQKIKESSPTDNEEVRAVRSEIEQICFGFNKFCDDDEDKLEILLTKFSKLTESGIGISQKEKIEIMRAMGFSKGHWFKCPNGHVYAIGECGGAMEVSKCNECGLQIGGSQHRLLGGNSVATEMDGARRGFWDEAGNNMANYRLN